MAYKSKAIKITIEEGMDETEYLMSNPKNKEAILRSVAQHEAGNVVIVKYGDL